MDLSEGESSDDEEEVELIKVINNQNTPKIQTVGEENSSCGSNEKYQNSSSSLRDKFISE